MKKKLIVLRAVCVILPCIINTSCLMLFDAVIASGSTGTSGHNGKITQNGNITQNTGWTIGQIKNEWDENTGKFFTQYNNNLTGFFTRSSNVNRSEVPIRTLKFSNLEGLSFYIPTATGSGPMDSMDVDIIVRQKNGEENRFIGFYYGPSSGKIEIEYNDELCNALFAEYVEIRVSINNSYYRYQFEFPIGFQEAYNKMNSEEITFVLDNNSIRLHWSLGQYVNEWGDGLGLFFTQYDGSIPAWFLESKKSRILIKDLTFSEAEGLSFPVTYILSNSFPSTLQVTIKQENGNENIFSARYSNSTRKIFVPYSEDLLNVLLLGNVELNFELKTTYTNYRYIFMFPEQFNLAYDKIKEREGSN